MKKYLAILLIIAGVFASYAPALRDGFVWDDTALILRDPLIRSWRLIPEGFNHFLFVDATASDFYRPLQRLTYTLDYAAFAAAHSAQRHCGLCQKPADHADRRLPRDSRRSRGRRVDSSRGGRVVGTGRPACI